MTLFCNTLLQMLPDSTMWKSYNNNYEQMPKAALAAFGVATVALSIKHLVKRLQQNQKVNDPEKSVEKGINRFIKLNAFEVMCLTKGAAPTSTITWFNGNHEEVAIVIQERFQQIIQSNPWLLGHFIKGNDGNYYIQYSELNATDQNAVTNIKQRLQDLKMFKHVTTTSTISMPLEDMKDQSTACHEFLLRMHCDWKQPFLKVSIVPSCTSPSSSFALIVSMSHVIGDGHTFYSLHNMLVGANDIRPLQATRIESTEEQQIKAMGKPEKEFTLSTSFMLCAIRGVLTRVFVGPFVGTAKYTAQSRYFLVDRTKMNQIKQEAVKDTTVPFCSSNDVITSWFLTNSQCEYGLMAINFRNRLEGHTDDHAGNYENLILYHNRIDGATPGLIRQSVNGMKRAISHDTFPSNSDVAFKSLAIITNWSTFSSRKIGLPNCQQQVHMPIYDLERTMPSTLALCIIFQARPNELAVCIAGTPDKMDNLREAPFEAIGSNIFA